jgi:hypothetical protein
MSNLIVNIRFWYWHLQIGEKLSSCKIVKNSSIDTLKDIPKIQVFKFFNCL